MGTVAYGWDDVQDDRDILQATEQELQQRRARLQALEPDAEMQDGEQPLEPAAESPTLVVSLPAVLTAECRVLLDLHVFIMTLDRPGIAWLCFMATMAYVYRVAHDLYCGSDMMHFTSIINLDPSCAGCSRSCLCFGGSIQRGSGASAGKLVNPERCHLTGRLFFTCGFATLTCCLATALTFGGQTYFWSAHMAHTRVLTVAASGG